MALTEAPIWDVPHEFTLWQPRRPGDPRSVFSYGLLLPQLAALATPAGVRRVAERWGLEDLVALSRKWRNKRGITREPSLAEQLASRLPEHAYLPEVDHLGEAVVAEELSEEQLAAAFDEFARTDGIGLVEWFGFRGLAGRRVPSPSHQLGRGLLGGLLSRVHESAGAAAPLNADALHDLPRVLYDTVDVPRRLRSVSDQHGRRVRAAGYTDLAERAAIEVDHLVFLRPRLNRCRLCGRIFVVTRTGEPESHCRQYLWARDHPHPMLERCVPPLGAERERLRKSLHAKYRRALHRHGGDGKAPAVRKTLKDYNDFMATHPAPPRGRRPDTRPGLLTDRRDQSD